VVTKGGISGYGRLLWRILTLKRRKPLILNFKYFCSMIYWIIALVVWLVVIPFAYKVTKKWDMTKFEKVYFAVIWPLLLPLYLIHWLHNLK
jgi:hypothetical protein